MPGTASMTSAELTAFLNIRLARRNRTQVFPDLGYEANQMILAKSSPALAGVVDGRTGVARDLPIGSLPGCDHSMHKGGLMAAAASGGSVDGRSRLRSISGSESLMNGAPPLDRLRAVMARLRDPQAGCPWDVKQTFATIAPYTIEEAYEVADAIERADLDALRDELGDLLLQVFL